jgi:hypothetical protein
MRLAFAYADSVMAAGIPRRTPIARAFTPIELQINLDTLSIYMSRLPDTSFYSIGGCSEVEIISWTAVEKLASLGPGVVPVLIEQLSDPDPFVRERVEEALMSATQDERILARSGGEYMVFYDQQAVPPREIAAAWWKKYGHFWSAADSTLRRSR